MAVIRYDQANQSLEEQKVVHKKGCYEFIATDKPCIFKVISKQGGYLVTLHKGRKKVWDDKAKTYKVKSQNTVKHVLNEKEAIALLREVEDYRAGKTQGKGRFDEKYNMKQLIADYQQSTRFLSLSERYKEYQINIFGHLLDYFTGEHDKFTSDLSTRDIEDYFYFQLQSGDRSVLRYENGEPVRSGKGLSPNTLDKHKSILKIIINFAMSCGDKYGISNNFVENAEIPKIKVEGYEKPLNHIPYHANTLTLEELNITLQDAIENEPDHSIVFLIALGALGGLRTSEIAGLKIGHFYHDNRMTFNEEVMKKYNYDVDYYKNNHELMFIHEAIKIIYNKEVTELPKGIHPRMVAIPDFLRKAADYMMNQRNQICNIAGVNPPSGTSRMYNPLVNDLKGTYIAKRKIYKKWIEYQHRRNRRLQLQEKEPIKILKMHELRHTHVTLLERAYPGDLSISWNVGHLIPINNTTKEYAHEPQPDRTKIIEYFDQNIKVDWSKAQDIKRKFKINKSGHLIVV